MKRNAFEFERSEWDRKDYTDWWNYPTMYWLWTKEFEWSDLPMGWVEQFDHSLASSILDVMVKVYTQRKEMADYLHESNKTVIDQLVGGSSWLVYHSRAFPAKIMDVDKYYVNIKFNGNEYALCKAITFPVNEKLDFMLKFI